MELLKKKSLKFQKKMYENLHGINARTYVYICIHSWLIFKVFTSAIVFSIKFRHLLCPTLSISGVYRKGGKVELWKSSILDTAQNHGKLSFSANIRLLNETSLLLLCKYNCFFLNLFYLLSNCSLAGQGSG